MTDGIIQRVFKAHLESGQHISITKLRQELIEKIKEETDRLYHIGYIEERKLIGDNQE